MANIKQTKARKQENADYAINSWMCSPEVEQVELAERAERAACDAAERERFLNGLNRSL